MHSVETDESEFHELLISSLNSNYYSVKTHYKSVISFTVLVSLITGIYSFYFAPIVFQSEITLIPSGGGVFEIVLNGQLIFSKKALNRFPEKGEIIKKLNV